MPSKPEATKPASKSKSKPNPKNLELWMVTCPFGENPTCAQFQNYQDLAEYIRDEIDGTETSIFIFEGGRLNISQGPHRYLLPVGDNPIPLFNVPDSSSLEPDETGFLGLIPQEDDSEEYEYVEVEVGEDEDTEETSVATFDDEADDFLSGEPAD